MGDHQPSRIDALNQASRIRTALNLIDKVNFDRYVEDVYDHMEKLYGPSHFDFKETDSGYVEYDGLKWAKAIDEKHNDEINQLQLQMLKQAYEQQERAYNLLWRFISHNIRNWWD